MNCRKARRQFSTGAASDELERHVATCRDCGLFVARLQAARRLFREHRSDFAPDAGFAARVGGRLPAEQEDPFSWAAVRVLPVTLALLAVLAWFSWNVPVSTTQVASPTDDLLSWVIEDEGETR